MPLCHDCDKIFKKSYVGSYETLCNDCIKKRIKKRWEKYRQNVTERNN